MKPHVINNNKRYKKLCLEFAHLIYNSNKQEYARRNQSNKEKVINDIANGKYAECLVFDFLLSNKKKEDHIAPVDFMLYPKEHKSYDADIKFNDIQIHVKSCLSSSNYPASWVFQPNDQLTISPSDKDYIALVRQDKECSFIYLLKAKDIVGFYRDPIKKTLKKKVLYEKDIKQI